MRDRIKQLNDLVNTLTKERDTAREEAAALQTKVDDLTTKFARSNVRRTMLEKEVSAASLMRLELLSQIKNDESRRLTALTSLRQPGVKGGLGIAVGGSPGARRMNVGPLSPLPVSKSPSESFLMNLQPDLDPDSSDDDIDLRELESTRRKLESRMKSGVKKSAPAIDLGKAAIEVVEDAETHVGRSEEVTQATVTHAGQSLAAVVHDNPNDANELVVRSEVPRENNGERANSDDAHDNTHCETVTVEFSRQPFDEAKLSDGTVNTGHETVPEDDENQENCKSFDETTKSSEGANAAEKESKEGTFTSTETTENSESALTGDGRDRNEAESGDEATNLAEGDSTDDDGNQREALLSVDTTEPNKDVDDEDKGIQDDNLSPRNTIIPDEGTNPEKMKNGEETGNSEERKTSTEDMDTKNGGTCEEGIFRGQGSQVVEGIDSVGERDDIVPPAEMIEVDRDMTCTDRGKYGKLSRTEDTTRLAKAMEKGAGPVAEINIRGRGSEEEVACQNEVSKPVGRTSDSNEESLEEIAQNEESAHTASVSTRTEEDADKLEVKKEAVELSVSIDNIRRKEWDGVGERNEVPEPVGNMCTAKKENRDRETGHDGEDEPAGNADAANTNDNEGELMQKEAPESCGDDNSANKGDAAALNEVSEPTENAGSGAEEIQDEEKAAGEETKPGGEMAARNWTGQEKIPLLDEGAAPANERELIQNDGCGERNEALDDVDAGEEEIVLTERVGHLGDVADKRGMAPSCTEQGRADSHLPPVHASMEQVQSIMGEGIIRASENSQLVGCTTEHGENELENNVVENEISTEEKFFNVSEREPLRGARSTDADQDQLSINRTPWMDTLNPKLQKNSCSWSLEEAIRLDSPQIPGVISSAMSSFRHGRNN